MLFSIPLAPRPAVKATEAMLERVYEAAKLGLKGDRLALASGLLPVEYRRLAELDPVVEFAALKGRADGEHEVSSALHAQALAGDAKAAMDILKHVHKWTAPQQLAVTIEGRISVLDALKIAETRVLTADYANVPQLEVESVTEAQFQPLKTA